MRSETILKTFNIFFFISYFLRLLFFFFLIFLYSLQKFSLLFLLNCFFKGNHFLRVQKNFLFRLLISHSCIHRGVSAVCSLHKIFHCATMLNKEYSFIIGKLLAFENNCLDPRSLNRLRIFDSELLGFAIFLSKG